MVFKLAPCSSDGVYYFMAYVYRHIRKDKNQPFYIGIGSDKNYRRANEVRGRNDIWNKIVHKSEYRIDILLDDLTWDEAKCKEKEFISLYGRIDNKTGVLSNMTDGGDGIVGSICSDETKRKISKSKIGKKLSKEHREKLCSASKNRHNGKNNNFYGKKHSELSKIKMSNSLKGTKSGEKNPMYGRPSINRKKVIDTLNGVIFECSKYAAEFYNIHPSTLKSKLNGNDKNNTTLMYLCDYEKVR